MSSVFKYETLKTSRSIGGNLKQSVGVEYHLFVNILWIDRMRKHVTGNYKAETTVGKCKKLSESQVPTIGAKLIVMMY